MPDLLFIERAAGWYLERWGTSRANLRKLLVRRVDKRVGEGDRAEALAEVEAVLDRCERAGLVDDDAYARAKVERMLARGTAAPAIRARLAAKGVKAVLPEDAALVGCCAYVRRRRLGPFRPEGDRAAEREKDLARIGRAGFPYEVARRVLAMDTDTIVSVATR